MKIWKEVKKGVETKIVCEMSENESETFANDLGNAAILIEGLRGGLEQWGDGETTTVKDMKKLVDKFSVLSSILFDPAVTDMDQVEANIKKMKKTQNK